MDQDTADAITKMEKQFVEADRRDASNESRIATLEEHMAKAFLLLDEANSKMTGLLSWTDQAPKASS